MILDNITIRRKEQLEREKQLIPPPLMKEMALSERRPVLDFYSALKASGISVIAEAKKASPSKGLIRSDFEPAKIARAYEQAGAAAISCLTEEFYFLGDNRYLSEIRKTVSLPVLRKDFIFDPYQVYHARVLGADAILLIAAMLGTDELHTLLALARSLGLHCLTEVHNERELMKALAVNAAIIGINNRDLRTFDVDLQTTAHLAGLIPDDVVKVSESGIRFHRDVQFLAGLGIDAVLVGETLMRSGDIGSAFQTLMKG